MSVTLPWPPAVLSPNERSHWRPKSAAAKKYRADCFYATKAGWPPRIENDDPVYLSIVFHPPTKRNRDQDNLVAMIKSGFDGIADALGVNDFRFKIRNIRIGEPMKGGCVKINITTY